jgi:hypothetical protein
MERLIPHLRTHFDALQDRLLCFTKHGVQTEGWFKGELLVLLETLVQKKVVESFDREVRQTGALIDLLVVSDRRHWVELKHWLIGTQKGTAYGPSFYFRDSSSVGIVRDARKLLSCPAEDQHWLLILAAANPGVELWRKGIQGFNEKFYPIRLETRTDPAEFPSSDFLGLLHIDQCARAIEEAPRNPFL